MKLLVKIQTMTMIIYLPEVPSDGESVAGDYVHGDKDEERC